MAFFPILFKFENALVVGGGKVALRKIKRVLEFADSVTCVSPDFCEEILLLEGVKRLERKFLDSDVNRMDMVFACTDDIDVNNHISVVCRKQKIICNVANLPDSSSFFVPSIIKSGDLTVAVSTNGKSPGADKLIKEKIRSILPKNISETIKNLGERRTILLESKKNVSEDEKYSDLLKELFI